MIKYCTVPNSSEIAFDPSLKAPIGYECPELSKDKPEKCIKTPADKCLLFLLRGLAFHWKQISGYQFVGKLADLVKLTKKK
jgi:hypothetical protein